MKILHTSDWHLGQRLHGEDRIPEQALALQWLLQTIESQAVDLLLVTGDIFDVGNPSNQARELYFHFLAQLQKTACRHVILVGGNHDSPSMLDAPGPLLRHFNIHVLGAASPDIQQQIIRLHDAQGQLAAVVAAVPFLRDRDLQYLHNNEEEEDREARLQAAIRGHYQALAEAVEPYLRLPIPIITTGHLFAHGASAKEKRSHIYIGSRSNLAAHDFPACFDYVALGHIHRPQAVGGLAHIRYAGSLIPLDFSEVADDKSVALLDFSTAAAKEPQHSAINDHNLNLSAGTPCGGKGISWRKTHFTDRSYRLQLLAVPTFRRLKRIEGNLAEVEEKIVHFLSKRSPTNSLLEEALPPFLEVSVQTQQPIPLLREKLTATMGNSPARLIALKLLYDRPDQPTTAQEPQAELSSLDAEAVFQQRLLGTATTLTEEATELLDCFRSLQNWLMEKDAL